MGIEDDFKRLLEDAGRKDEGDESIKKLLSYQDEISELVKKVHESSILFTQELLNVARDIEISDVDMMKLSSGISMVHLSSPWPDNLLIIFKLGMAYERKIKA